MSTTYRLPCNCGAVHQVTVRQAGQSLDCSCGSALEVPTLRGLRELEPADVQTEKRKSAWTFGKGLTFAIGALLVLVGTGLALWTHNGVRFFSQHVDPLTVDVDAHRQSVQETPADELWNIWTQLRQDDIGARLTPQHIIARRQVLIMSTVRNIAIVAGAVGLVALVVSVRL